MVKLGQIYRHYKGGVYTVTGVGRHSETLEKVVVYQGKNGDIWLRPLAMFEEALSDGRQRFEVLENSNADGSTL